MNFQLTIILMTGQIKHPYKWINYRSWPHDPWNDSIQWNNNNTSVIILCKIIGWLRKIYRRQRWCRSRESSTPLFGWFMIMDHVIMWHRPCTSFTGYQLQRESSSNSASWYTTQSMVVHIVSNRVDYSRSQHPRTRLSPLSWKARSDCSAFETGFIRAGVLRRCT